MAHVRAWQEPEYPEGEWIDQEQWEETGIEDVFGYAEASEDVELSDVEEGFFAVYSENDIGSERIIPLEYSGEKFSTIRGVFDSNPGKSQRYTPWETEYGIEELEEDLEAMEGKLVGLEDQYVESVEENFSGRDRKFEAYETIFAGVTGFFLD
jgi:hypothetical protein